LAAFGANCRCLRTFGNFTAAWRAFYKTAAGTLGLVWLATQLAALYLTAMSTKLDACGRGGPRAATSTAGFLAAVDAQNHPSQNHYNENYQTFLPRFHN
jgi:hypothetical protein